MLGGNLEWFARSYIYIYTYTSFSERPDGSLRHVVRRCCCCCCCRQKTSQTNYNSFIIIIIIIIIVHFYGVLHANETKILRVHSRMYFYVRPTSRGWGERSFRKAVRLTNIFPAHHDPFPLSFVKRNKTIITIIKRVFFYILLFNILYRRMSWRKRARTRSSRVKCTHYKPPFTLLYRRCFWGNIL